MATAEELYPAELGLGAQRASEAQGPSSKDSCESNTTEVINNHLQLLKIKSLQVFPHHYPQHNWWLYSSHQDTSYVWSPTIPCKSLQVNGSWEHAPRRVVLMNILLSVIASLCQACLQKPSEDSEGGIRVITRLSVMQTATRTEHHTPSPAIPEQAGARARAGAILTSRSPDLIENAAVVTSAKCGPGVRRRKPDLWACRAPPACT